MLLTKFFLPELRADRVSRPRLLERLSHFAQSSLVVVSAPAGFGKTSLVSEWIRASGLRAAWISLDESDNDPARFWMAVANALEMLFPSVGKNAQDLLSRRQPPAAQALLTTLLNDLAIQAGNESDGPPTYLVLDDLHRINNAAIYEGLLFLAERLPPRFHMALIGRSDPPLPLGRLRASGKLLEIRGADLRFTLPESQEFLNRVMELPLTPAQVQLLNERTEGWIAGLQLAGLAMQGLRSEPESGNLAAFIDSFSGDDRYILDYLVEEVLSRLPDEARAFLLQTSILERLCGPLCDAVCSYGTSCSIEPSGSVETSTGMPEGSGQAMLERLERENLFLIPLDNRRTWYRYHHLFADLLRHQLERQGEEASAALHRRAAEWLAAHAMLPEAIGHALQGGDCAAAASWIEAYGEQALSQGEYATLKSWIEALPEAIRSTRPKLLLHYAWTMNYLAEVGRYEQILAAAERLWREQGNQAGLAEALNLRADFAASIGEGEKAAELAQQALELLPEDDAYRRGISWMYLGSAAFLKGDMPTAQNALTTGKTLCERSGNTTGARQAAMMLAQVHIAQANLPQAAQMLEEIQCQAGDLPIYEGLMARLLLSTIWSEWNRLEDATAMLRRVLESAEQTGQILYFHRGYLHLAQILWENGDLAGMQAALARHAPLADQIGGQRLHELSAAFRAYLALLSGDTQAALRWKESLLGEPDEPVGFLNELYHLILVRVCIWQGEAEARQALDILGRLENAAQSQQRMGSLVEIWLLKALALSKLGDRDGAGEALEKSLSLARSGGYRRLYIDEGRPFFDLLALLARKPALSPELRGYISELRRFAPAQASLEAEVTTRAANQALIEPLTPREIEVLRLIQAGRSNSEIADQLYLTLNTVKVHVKNIFAKLEVSSRTQAVRRAEELSLI